MSLVVKLIPTSAFDIISMSIPLPIVLRDLIFSSHDFNDLSTSHETNKCQIPSSWFRSNVKYETSKSDEGGLLSPKIKFLLFFMIILCSNSSNFRFLPRPVVVLISKFLSRRAPPSHPRNWIDLMLIQNLER